MIQTICEHLATMALEIEGTQISFAQKPKSIPEQGLPCAIVAVANSSIQQIGNPLILLRRVFPITWYVHKITKDSLPSDEILTRNMLDLAVITFLGRVCLGTLTLPNVPFVQELAIQDAGSVQTLKFGIEEYYGFVLNFQVTYYQKVTRKGNQ